MVDEALLFEWDEAKSARNLRERGFDFEFVTGIFDGPVVDEEDPRRDYGERRFHATGQMEGRFFVVVYTWRGDRRRIISARARRAGESEMTTIRRSLAEIRRRGGGKVDWALVDATTEEDIRKMIESDPDTAPDLSVNRDWRKVIAPYVPDVRALRRKLGLSQAQFASKFGFSVRTIQEWEQGRAIPDRPARILLRVIEKSPKTVERAVAAG